MVTSPLTRPLMGGRQQRVGDPTVSALIITYRHGPYIGEAIASALAQTRPPDQVVVVDDGSPDDTAARARTFADPRVEVVDLPHRGLGDLAGTYNEGLARCRTDLVAVLEGDDRWPPGKLETQLQAFGDPSVVLSHGQYRVIDADGRVRHGGVGPPFVLAPGRYDARPHILRASYIMMVTVVMRRETMHKAGGFRQLDGTFHCDYPTFLSLAALGRFHFVAGPVGDWRRHRGAGTYRVDEVTGASAARRLAQSAREQWGDPALPSARQIDQGWIDADARRAWDSARMLLIEKRRREAWGVVRTALASRASLPLRLRLLVVGAAALTGRDVEWFLRRVGRRSALSDG